MPIRSRAEWGAAPPSGGYSWLPDNVRLTVHWEGPRMGAYSPDAVPGLLRGIQRYHMQAQGWTDIAYSFVVDRYGDIWEGRGWNARTAANGTNAGNSGWLAVCYLGGEGDEFTVAAQNAIRELTQLHLARGGLPPVNCHRDHVATACPGDVIAAWVNAGGPLSGATFAPAQEEDDLTPEQAQQLAQVTAWLNPATVGGDDRTPYEAILRFVVESEGRLNGALSTVTTGLGMLAAAIDRLNKRLDAITMGEGPESPGASAAEVADELARRLAN